MTEVDLRQETYGSNTLVYWYAAWFACRVHPLLFAAPHRAVSLRPFTLLSDMKKRLFYFLLLPILVACGDDANEEATAVPESPPVAAQPSPAPAEPPAFPPPPPVAQPEIAPPAGTPETRSMPSGTEMAPSGKSAATERDRRAANTPAKSQSRQNGNGGEVHVVKSGDTLASIARANGVTYQELAKWNKLSDPGKLRVGQKIRLSEP